MKGVEKANTPDVLERRNWIENQTYPAECVITPAQTSQEEGTEKKKGISNIGFLKSHGFFSLSLQTNKIEKPPSTE